MKGRTLAPTSEEVDSHYLSNRESLWAKHAAFQRFPAPR
jgi:hypothetical protein